MEKKTQSGGIASIIGIVILGTFATVIGKSCGKSASTRNNLTQNETPAPPSRGDLQTYKVAGLSLLMPGSPIRENMELPPGASDMVSLFESHKFTDKSMHIAVTHAIYNNTGANLDGSADGAMTGVQNLAGVSAFTGSKKETVIDGLEGREMTMNYMNGKFNIDQYGLVFTRGRELWQIQISGEGSHNRKALEDFRDTVFESIKVTTRN